MTQQALNELIADLAAGRVKHRRDTGFRRMVLRTARQVGDPVPIPGGWVVHVRAEGTRASIVVRHDRLDMPLDFFLDRDAPPGSS